MMGLNKLLYDLSTTLSKQKKFMTLLECNVEAIVSEDAMLIDLYAAREEAIARLNDAEERAGVAPSQFDPFEWPPNLEETVERMRQTLEACKSQQREDEADVRRLAARLPEEAAHAAGRRLA